MPVSLRTAHITDSSLGDIRCRRAHRSARDRHPARRVRIAARPMLTHAGREQKAHVEMLMCGQLAARRNQVHIDIEHTRSQLQLLTPTSSSTSRRALATMSPSSAST